MNNDKKLSRAAVAQYLKEALQIFCDPLNDLRPELADPFRQDDYVMASDGRCLIRIKAKEAGVAVSPFKKMYNFDAQKPVPFIGFNELLNARVVRRVDIVQTIVKLKQFEEEYFQLAVASINGVKLSIECLSHIEKAMAICGAHQARLVWSQDYKVMLELDNEKHCTVVTILLLGLAGEDSKWHVITLPSCKLCENTDVSVNWQKGMEYWNELKAKMAREAEEERMARRTVYLVEVVKIAYIPVYAKDEKEARQLCEKNFIEPEDDGDDEWMLGDMVPEPVDMEDLFDCYEHVVTMDGVVDRDAVCKLDQISQEYQRKHNKEE